jgi:X-Pro dipeptidyl-peptidase
MTTRSTLLHLAAAACAATLLVVTLGAAGGADSAAPASQAPAPAPPAGKAQPLFQDGQAQVVPAFQDATQWIKQELWVETEFDSDGDGRKDRVHVDVTRPRQTDTEGLKVPVVYESSPYFAGTSGDRKFLWNVRQELGVEPPPRTSQPAIPFKPERPSISNSEVATWLPRGFAVVHSEAPGTGLSDGCPTVGDVPERFAPKAVIDWLNGRASGFTTRTGTEPVAAAWSTGKVGMTGTSYNGTLPIAAATTGVKGLEAIIPIAPNTSYYHYYRSNGLVRHPGGWLGEDIDFLYDFIHSGDPALRDHCNATIRDGLYAAHRARGTGDYNDFWETRDLLTVVKKIKAATLLAHGLNDWNVVPEHSVRIYEALKRTGTPVRLYLHQGGHGGPPPLDMRVRWFTRFLYGVENGVEKEPRAMIVREGGNRNTPPTPYADYPNPDASPVALYPDEPGNLVGKLTFRSMDLRVVETLVDDVQFGGEALASAAASPNRLLYATPELAEPLHISGTPRVTITLASSKPAANLSVWLVMLPFDKTAVGSQGIAGVVTRGWADPQNHKSLKDGGNYASKRGGEPLEPGKFYTLTFDLQPDDQVVPAGKRLALMVMSSDRDFTLWPPEGTELQLRLDKTRLVLPVVGGVEAFQKAAGFASR